MPLLLVLLVSGGSYCLFIDDLVNMTSLSDPMFSPCFLKLSAFPVCFQANPEQKRSTPGIRALCVRMLCRPGVVRPDAVPSRCCASGCCAVQAFVCPGVCASGCCAVQVFVRPGVCASGCCASVCCAVHSVARLPHPMPHAADTRQRSTPFGRGGNASACTFFPAKICSGFVFFLMEVPTRNRILWKSDHLT